MHIDAAASRLELRVRAAGPLAPLGHAHVLLATQIAGELQLDRDLQRTLLQLRIPVAGIIVDDPQARADAGGEFARSLPEEARRGTREHMLGASQLAAERYPLIVLECRGLQVLRGDANAGEGVASLGVLVRDRDATLSVPVAWTRQGDAIELRGEFKLLQSALGLEPYSVGGGALRVADEVDAKFVLSAR